MKKQFDQEQIIAIPREGKAGTPVKELCRKHKSSDATFS